MTRHTWLSLLLISSMVCLAAGSSVAQLLPFPPAPITAAAAAEQFDARAMVVIHVNACRRVDSSQLAAGKKQGLEELLGDVIVGVEVGAKARKVPSLPSGRRP